MSDDRVIVICAGSVKIANKIIKVISIEDNCQPGVFDIDNHVEDWKGSGKRKMKRIR